MAYLSNEEILRVSSHFFSSDEWWKPVLTFLFTKCRCFRSATPTHEEYSLYQEFMTLIQDLVDNKLCGQMRITPQSFENALESLYDDGNISAKVIIDTLTNAADFVVFRQQMLQNNIRIENRVTKGLLDYTEEHPEETDGEKVALAVVELVQRQEDEEMEKLLAKSKHQMHALLCVDGLDEKKRKLQTPPRKPPPGAIDPEEVERRRKFYVQQREILRDVEERQGRKRKRVRVVRDLQAEPRAASAALKVSPPKDGSVSRRRYTQSTPPTETKVPLKRPHADST